jgi:PAS domain S-box-containing protein
VDERVSAHFIQAFHAARAAGHAGPRARETAAVAWLQSLVAIANADAAIIAVRVASAAGPSEFVASYGLGAKSTSAYILDLLGSCPSQPAGVSAEGSRHLVMRPGGQWAARLRDVFDFGTEVSFEWFPTDDPGQPVSGAWLITRGARAPLDEERAALIGALTDLLAATLVSPETSDEPGPHELRRPSLVVADTASDAARNDSVSSDPEALLDALGIAVLLVADDGTIELVNSEVERLLGLKADQLVGTRVNSGRFTISHIDGTPWSARERLFSTAIQTGRPTPQVEIIVQRPDGTEIGLYAWARPIFHAGQSRPIGAAMFLKHLTKEPAASGLQARLAALELAFEQLAPKMGATRSVTRPAPSDLAVLSNRERQVLMLFAAGLRVANIAEELYLSEHTVRNHLKGIFRKLGVSTQAELVRRLRATQPEIPDAADQL